MKIFFPDIHFALTNAFARACEKLGHTVLVPSKEWRVSFYPHPPVNRFVWNETLSADLLKEKGYNKNILAVSKEELFDLKPEIIFVTAYENQLEVLEEVWKKQNWGAKLCFYSGNDYWEGAYPLDEIKNYLAADLTAIRICEKNKINHHKYIPYLDDTRYSDFNHSDSKSFVTAIGEYQKLFRNDFIYYRELQASTPYVEYDLHTKSPQNVVIDAIKSSSAMLHVKRLEGFGIAVSQAVLLGRPVFVPKWQAENKRYSEFLIDGVSAIYFSSKEEYIKKSFEFVNCKDYKFRLQESTAALAKDFFGKEKNLKELNQFLSNLI